MTCGNITLTDAGFLNLRTNNAFANAVGNKRIMFTQVVYYEGMSPYDAFSLNGVYVVGTPKMKITGLQVRIEFWRE